MKVCIIRRSFENFSPPDVPLCTATYTSLPSDTCSTVVTNKFGGDASKFFVLNPGLYCSNFNRGVTSNYTSVGQQVPNSFIFLHSLTLVLYLSCSPIFFHQVCTAATDYGTIKKGCKTRYVTLRPGDSCPSIYIRYFCGRRGLFRILNKNWSCESRKLLVSRTNGANLGVCVPLSC